MGALLSTALDDTVNKITGGNSGTPETLWCFKDDRVGAAAPTTAVLGKIISLWTQNGFPGSSGAAPGTTPRQCTSSTAGAMPLTNASGGRDKYLIGASMHCVQPGTLLLYDRLADVSGLDATVTSAQTFAAGASLTPTRYTDGKYVQAWLEIYTTIGTTPALGSIIYTNELATGSRTSPGTRLAATGTFEAQRMLPLSLAGGDFGIQSVQSVTITPSTTVAGNVGVTLVRPLLMIPVQNVGSSTIRDLLVSLPSIVNVQPNACLAWAYLSAVTAQNAAMFGHLQTIEV